MRGRSTSLRLWESPLLFAAIVGLLSVEWIWRRRAPVAVSHLPVDRGTLVVVGVFLAGMVAVGPYLEFPSDPLEYLYRVQAWEKVRWMDYTGYGKGSIRFPSFVEHFLLRSSGISVGDRWGLGLLCAVMEATFLWQFIRLGALLTGNVAWGWLAAVLSIGYFGYNAISVFSYVVLSGPLVSTVVYLGGLVLVFAAFFREEWRWFLLTPPLLVFCWVSHEQGVLFLLGAMSGISLLMLVFRYRSLSRTFRRALVVMTAAIMVPIVLFASTRPSRDWEGLASPHVATLGKVLGHHLRYHPVDVLHQLLALDLR